MEQETPGVVAPLPPEFYPMKSAYELAMERLNKQSPSIKLTSEQKKQLADLDSKYTARIAEREIGLKSDIAKAIEAGNVEEAEALEQQLASERKKLLAELEEKKEQVRRGSR